MPSGGIHSIISAEPQTDGHELDEGKIVGGELVVTGGDASALLDLVEEPLDQVPRSVKVRAEADRLSTGSLRRDAFPCSSLDGEFSDPVGVISAIGQQRCPRSQFTKQDRTEAIVVRFTRA
jgi:hypothetical protein